MARGLKNPFMSLRLSAANRIANTGCGAMAAAARRQQSAMTAGTTHAVAGFWSRALGGTKAPRRARRR